MVRKKGFLLLEVMLAVGILGGAVLCFLGLFTPILSKVRDIEVIEGFEDVERKVNAFIQMRSFKEIYVASKAQETFYFYEGENGRQEVSKSLSDVKGSLGSRKIIRTRLSPASMKNVLDYGPENYPESYFAIWVEVCQLDNVRGQEEIEGPVYTYTVIKNR